jgi:hypothetical protein
LKNFKPVENKLLHWYKRLRNGKQLAVLVALHWAGWGLALFLLERGWPDDEPETWPALLFEITLMSLWMAIAFHWKKVKLLFKKEANVE